MIKCSCSYETYHKFFSNLANPLKIKIILCLRESSKSVSELVKCIGEEQTNISHCLKALRECNIVNFEKKGKERVYSLNKNTIEPMLKLIDKHAKTQCKECPFKK
jgi:ArsR family transcriptional regulator, zinc-responsive transcriptional repressor